MERIVVDLTTGVQSIVQIPPDEATAIVAAAATIVPTPNPGQFTQDVKTSLGGIVGANALMQLYPAFFPAVQSAAWPDVQALVLDAQAKSAITPTQYAAIKAAATANNIPVTLP